MMRSLNAMVMSIVLFLAFLIGTWTSSAQNIVPDRRPLLTIGEEVADVTQQPNGRVWVATRTFDVYTAMPGERVWKHERLEFDNLQAKLEVKRVSRIFFLTDSVGILVGNILTYEKGDPVSCVLRTTNGGRSWSTSIITNDTMALADAMRLTTDGMMFMLDHTGRLWTSLDTGVVWKQGKLPTSLMAGDAMEMDMITSKLGATIDRYRSISFTTDGWKNAIEPRVSKRPILRTQPNMLDQYLWARDFFMWNDRLIVTEGRDVYVTLMNDLVWDRWDSVASVCLSDDRMYLYYIDVKGQLWQWKTGEPIAVKVADGIVSSRLMRAAHGRIIFYRSDTGPVVVDNSGVVRMRLYAETGEFKEPTRTVFDKDTEWGVGWNSPNELTLDVYKRQMPKGQWQRDTFLVAGKTQFRAVGDDSLVFGEGSSSTIYDAKKRTHSKFTLTKPIESFFRTPISSFRVSVERQSRQASKKWWCDYKLKSGSFQSTELIDSAKDGVHSEQFSMSHSREEITTLLTALNNDANAYPSPASFTFTDAEKLKYRSMLDTIFQYDVYFDTLDQYRPPPPIEIQIEACKVLFANVFADMATMSNERFGEAILSLRHRPTNRFVRYAIEFVNTSGDVLIAEMDRTNEVNLPLMMPWKVTLRGQSWHWYGRAMGPFFISSFPPGTMPPIVHQMMDPSWLLLGVAASLDYERYGRMHQWYQKPWSR
ncbi:MAG: hypothetical protein NTX15_01100 [Candidatus Kapabacteria bacterium]|nr:hypothetical protein [Candidatus Kapabacteria bacterium]